MATPALRIEAAEPSPRRGQGARPFRRIGLFVVGLVLNVLGAAAWLVSMLLTAPLMLAGVWVWAREFHWARRLLKHVRRWAGALWRRTRGHPWRWGIGTAVSVGGTATAYWLMFF